MKGDGSIRKIYTIYIYIYILRRRKRKRRRFAVAKLTDADRSGLFLVSGPVGELKNLSSLIYVRYCNLRMHKHRLAYAGLFLHLPLRSSFSKPSPLESYSPSLHNYNTNIDHVLFLFIQRIFSMLGSNMQTLAIESVTPSHDLSQRIFFLLVSICPPTLGLFQLFTKQ